MEKSIEWPAPVKNPSENSSNHAKDRSENAGDHAYNCSKYTSNYSEESAGKSNPDREGENNDQYNQ